MVDALGRKGAPCFVAKLAWDRVSVRELQWFFTEAESEVGLPSNFEPIMEQARTRSTGSRDSPEDRVEATHAEAIIRRWLHAMPPRDASVLMAAFEPRPWPPKLEAELGPLTGIAVRVLTAQRGPAKDVRTPRRQDEDAAAAWLNDALGREGSLALAPVRAKAQALFIAALKSYANVRCPGPSVVPER
jgi:hypothetical protein